MSNKVCFPNKTEDLNLSVFNVITGINESKTLAKHISCECKCKFNGRKCSRCECKKHHVCEKDHIWNPATSSCKNGKYLASIIDNLVIKCDEIREAEIKTAVQHILIKINITCKTQNFNILLPFLITLLLLITVNIYCFR